MARPRSKFALPLSVLLGLFGVYRLYGFTQTGEAADLLSGFGFIAFALSYFHGAGYKADPSQRYPWHYATILGTVLILSALVTRLVAAPAQAVQRTSYLIAPGDSLHSLGLSGEEDSELLRAILKAAIGLSRS